MGVITPERRRSKPSPQPAPPQYQPLASPPQYPPPAPPPRERRELRVPWGLITLGIIIIAVFGGVSWVKGVIPDIHNPFAAHTVDRSGPALLTSIQSLNEYHAATGNFQQLVDLREDTALPASILGERTLFVAVGTVDATVDFSRIGSDAVQVSDDRRSATITLARPQLSEAQLDVGKSYVYDQDSGLLNKMGSLFGGNSGDERDIYTLAQQKIQAAAQNGSGLVLQAEANTRQMLRSLLRTLGFTSVVVRFS